MSNHRATCRECGSHNVTKDAVVRWDEFHQVWDLATIYDSGDCHDCGASGNNVVEWIDDRGEIV